MAAAGTAEFWKHWEGRSVGEDLTLMKCLGGGANSAVFLTTLPGSDGQRAAVRLVRANPSTAELQLSRWQRAARLSHPNLIRLLNSGRCQLDDTAMLYVVMEYAEEDLSQVVPDRPLTGAEARDMLGPVLSALRYIHRQGFIHGRIKPANIMAAGDQVKLSSDGIWRAGETSDRRTAPGRYDPPEMVTGGLSPASDVWSLGVTLVEVLTQKLPVWADPGSRLSAGQELALPEGLAAPFPEIIRHCLHSDPRSRWTVDQIAAVLSQVGSAGAVSAPSRTPDAFAAPKSSAPWRIIVPLAAVALVAGVLFWNRSTTPSAPDAAPPVVAQTSQTAPAAAAPAAPAAESPAPAPAPEPPARGKKSKKEPAPQAGEKADEKPDAAAAGVQAPPASGDIMIQVMPKIPQHSLDAVRGHFAVVIRTMVDSSGNVTEAHYETRGQSRFFAEHTLAAARQWHFKPADGPQQWLLRFDYSKGAMTVTPTKSN